MRGARLVFCASFAALAGCASRPPPAAPARGAIEGHFALLRAAEREPGCASVAFAALAHPSLEVRAHAARALANRAGTGTWSEVEARAAAVALLERAASDDSPDVQAEALFALRRLADPASSAALARLALHPDPTIRALALVALARLPSTGAALLAPALGDPAVEARGAAAVALSALPAGAAGAADDAMLESLLESRLEAETDEATLWKLHCLLARRPRLLDQPALRARARSALSSPNFAAAVFAAEALGAWALAAAQDEPYREAVEALSAAVTDRRRFWLSRAAAAAALYRLAAGPVETKPGGSIRAAFEQAKSAASSGEDPWLLRELIRAGLGEAPIPGGTPDAANDGAGRPAALPVLVLEAQPGRGLGADADRDRGGGCPRRFRASLLVRGRGRIRLEVYADEAPETAAAFRRLAAAGALNGAGFRWVARAAAAAAGGPAAPREAATGAGASTPAAPFLERTPLPLLRGSVGAVRVGEGGLRLVFTHLPAPDLEDGLTVFARVIDGMEVADRLSDSDVLEGSSSVEGGPSNPAGRSIPVGPSNSVITVPP